MFVSVLLVSVLLVWGDAAVAQPTKEPQPPENVTVQTRDNVGVHLTYYPGPGGRESAVVMLLHMYSGNRNDYATLARQLQAAGHAVVVPDLRGHGASTKVRGEQRRLDAKSLPSAQFFRMVDQDLEAVRRFLQAENDEGRLNIEKLCVVGAEMGAVVALNWAALDWSYPPLATGKQGQYVKGLVLISPTWFYKGLTINDAIAQESVRGRIAMLIAVGNQDRKALADADRLRHRLERFHPPPRSEADQDFFYVPYETSLQGTKILEENLKLDRNILKFVDLRIAQLDIPWNAVGR
jgi:alpha-beta hydrolase superfamily lysophospholipase